MLIHKTPLFDNSFLYNYNKNRTAYAVRSIYHTFIYFYAFSKMLTKS